MLRLAIYAFLAVAGLSYAEQQGLIPTGAYFAQAPRLPASALSTMGQWASSGLQQAASLATTHPTTPRAESFTARIAARGS